MDREINKYIINVKNITKTIIDGTKKVDILKNIDLRVERGEFISIMGSSGAGKSTLVSLLAGIDKPSKGNIFIDSEDITKKHNKQLAQYRNESVGIVFQNFNLLDDFTAIENILIPSFFNDKKKSLKNRAYELIKLVGMEGKEKLYPNQLSGGEKQRIAIARALILKPKILLADEPTGALDRKTSEQIMDIFMRSNVDFKMTIVMITHEQHIADFAERIVYLEDGLLIGEKYERS